MKPGLGFGLNPIDLGEEHIWPIIGPSSALIPASPAADKVERLRKAMQLYPLGAH